MTDREAAEIIGELFDNTKGTYNEVLGLAYDALLLRVPVKPDFEGDGYADGNMVYDTWICPYCGAKYEVDYEQHRYCPNCGQALDWSEIYDD